MANGYDARSDKHQGGFNMWFIPLAAEVCKIAIAAIILYFVVDMITPMPGWARQVVILSPIQTVTLIITFGLIVQGYAVIRLRRALKWRRLWPFILGAAFGVPAGVAVLGWADPAHVRAATGAFLILYSLYATVDRPARDPCGHIVVRRAVTCRRTAHPIGSAADLQEPLK
jgi:uncharacterized membrane protein YfcA